MEARRSLSPDALPAYQYMKLDAHAVVGPASDRTESEEESEKMVELYRTDGLSEKKKRIPLPSALATRGHERPPWTSMYDGGSTELSKRR